MTSLDSYFFTLLFSAGCSSCVSEQSNKNQPATISTTENNTSEDINQNNIENSDVPLLAQPIEEHGQLFMGLNLDGIGNYDDEAYVRLYVWDHNGFGRYDASQLVIRQSYTMSKMLAGGEDRKNLL